MDKILLAHNEQANESYIVEVSDGTAATMMSDYGTDVLDLGFPEDQLPDSQGLHLWEGTITEGADDYTMDGVWRGLTADELRKLQTQGYIFPH